MVAKLAPAAPRSRAGVGEVAHRRRPRSRRHSVFSAADGDAHRRGTRPRRQSEACDDDDHDTPAALDAIAPSKREHVLQTYRREPVALVRGAGVRLYDARGPRYLDLLSGIGVASLGHAHPASRARSRSRRRRWSTRRTCSSTRCRASSPSGWPTLSGLPRAFFCNSGTEAVEACLKFARRYWHTQGAPSGREFVAFDAGRSPAGRWAALSVTWDEHYRDAVPAAARRASRSCRPTTRRQSRAAVTGQTAAIIVEPIQGEGGVRPISPAVGAARSRRRARGPARCSSPTRCSAASAAQACRSSSPALGLTPRPRSRRQGARRRACRSPPR